MLVENQPDLFLDNQFLQARVLGQRVEGFQFAVLADGLRQFGRGFGLGCRALGGQVVGCEVDGHVFLVAAFRQQIDIRSRGRGFAAVADQVVEQGDVVFVVHRRMWFSS